MLRFFIQAEVKVTKEEHIEKLVDSETRIILLYSTKDEANNIMEWAREKELTGNNYVCHSVSHWREPEGNSFCKTSVSSGDAW